MPPTITAKPEDNYHLSGNQPVIFPVQFQSRFQTDTVIVWYKNEDTAVPQDLIQTSYENDLSGRTQVQFQPLRRRDAGVYRVVIENTFQGIPVGLRQTEASFRVQVTGEGTSRCSLDTHTHTHTHTHLDLWSELGPYQEI